MNSTILHCECGDPGPALRQTPEVKKTKQISQEQTYLYLCEYKEPFIFKKSYKLFINDKKTLGNSHHRDSCSSFQVLHWKEENINE